MPRVVVFRISSLGYMALHLFLNHYSMCLSENLFHALENGERNAGFQLQTDI